MPLGEAVWRHPEGSCSDSAQIQSGKNDWSDRAILFEEQKPWSMLGTTAIIVGGQTAGSGESRRLYSPSLLSETDAMVSWRERAILPLPLSAGRGLLGTRHNAQQPELEQSSVMKPGGPS